jgi:hypothetical protein
MPNQVMVLVIEVGRYVRQGCENRENSQRSWCSPLPRASLIQVIHAKFVHHDGKIECKEHKWEFFFFTYRTLVLQL